MNFNFNSNSFKALILWISSVTTLGCYLPEDLKMSIKSADINLVRQHLNECLEKGIIDDIFQDGTTPFQHACTYNSPEIVSLLIDYGFTKTLTTPSLGIQANSPQDFAHLHGQERIDAIQKFNLFANVFGAKSPLEGNIKAQFLLSNCITPKERENIKECFEILLNAINCKKLSFSSEEYERILSFLSNTEKQLSNNLTLLKSKEWQKTHAHIDIEKQIKRISKDYHDLSIIEGRLSIHHKFMHKNQPSIFSQIQQQECNGNKRPYKRLKH